MTANVTISGVARTLVSEELRASNEYDWRYVRSSTEFAPGMSASSSAFASISTDLRSGCGCETTAVLASRLSENACATARASGVPALAVYLTFFASS